MLTVGEGTLASGHPMVFRIYADTHGTKAGVTYAQFTSVDDAKEQIAEWLQIAQRVLNREQNKGEGGKLITDRIVAFRREPKSGKKEYLIIRRNGLNCYFIRSFSLQVAGQVEDLILRD